MPTVATISGYTSRMRMERSPAALTKAGKVGVDDGDTSPAFSPDGRWVAFERAVDFGSARADSS